MYEWFAQWRRMVKNSTHMFGPQQLRDMLLVKIGGSKDLAMILTSYRYTVPEHQRTYDHLLALVDQFINGKLTEAARARQERDLANLNKNKGVSAMTANTPSPKTDTPVPKPGKGKGRYNPGTKFITQNPNLSIKKNEHCDGVDC